MATLRSRRRAEVFDPSAIDALLADVKAAGTPIDRVDGLLNQMTKAVLERALQAEMTHHLGYDRDDPAGAGTGNSRSGSSTETVSTVNGPVAITVPRDRNSEFEPQITLPSVSSLPEIWLDWVPSTDNTDTPNLIRYDVYQNRRFRRTWQHRRGRDESCTAWRAARWRSWCGVVDTSGSVSGSSNAITFDC